MKIRVLERFSESKHKDSSRNEDGIFINDSFVVIVDGATAKNDFLWKGKSSGIYIKELIINCIREMPSNVSSLEFFNRINKSIIYDLNIKDVFVETPSASVVAYSLYNNQIWRVGDCSFMVNGHSYMGEKKIDRLLSEVRSLMLQLEIIQGSNLDDLLRDDIGRRVITPILEKQHLIQNNNLSEYSYNSVNGSNLLESEIEVFTLGENDLDIVLASDGYPRLYATLEKSEKYLHNVIASDPLMIGTVKSTKGVNPNSNSYDDRAYVSFYLER